jgi:hypothetical protein
MGKVGVGIRCCFRTEIPPKEQAMGLEIIVMGMYVVAYTSFKSVFDYLDGCHEWVVFSVGSCLTISRM